MISVFCDTRRCGVQKQIFLNCRDDLLLKLLAADVWSLKVSWLEMENVVPPRFSPWKMTYGFLSHFNKLTEQMFFQAVGVTDADSEEDRVSH